jgi:transposase InsO family protein
MMDLPLSTYYSDSKKTRAQKEEEDADIRGKIEQIRVEFPRTGYRTLLQYLKRSGVIIGETKLRRVLNKFNLKLIPKKKFVVTTDSRHECLTHPNLIKGMTIDGVNQVWASDITYIRINNGFVYLAVILDLYSRKVVGFAVSKRIDSALVIDALDMAIKRRKPPQGTIHHSDRGVQYLCDAYVSILKQNHFHLSCSAKGNPYDNAWAESFMKTLKYEEIYMGSYETYLDVVEKLPHFIEEVYNKKRLHSSINYLPPAEFEEISLKGKPGKILDRPTFTL